MSEPVSVPSVRKEEHEGRPRFVEVAQPAGTPPSQPPGSIPEATPNSLSNDKVIEFVALRAAEIVDERIGKRDTRVRAITGIIIFGLAFLGYQRIDALTSQEISGLKEQVAHSEEVLNLRMTDLNETHSLRLAGLANDSARAAIRDEEERITALNSRLDAVQQRIDDIDGTWIARASLLELEKRVGDMTRNDTISMLELQEAMELVRTVAANRSPLLVKSLPPVADAFVRQVLMLSSRRSRATIDELCAVALDAIDDDPATIGLLARHFALRLLAPINSDKASDQRNFLHFAKRAQDVDNPQFAMPHLLVLEWSGVVPGLTEPGSVLMQRFDGLTRFEQNATVSLLRSEGQYDEGEIRASNDEREANALIRAGRFYREFAEQHVHLMDAYPPASEPRASAP